MAAPGFNTSNVVGIGVLHLLLPDCQEGRCADLMNDPASYAMIADCIVPPDLCSTSPAPPPLRI
ncbi:hypothetical protein J6590_017907 [Homalodisca vitripennis]|nr:hypothetical protein J6590_017907 [Homalodisca vitripennis]